MLQNRVSLFCDRHNFSRFQLSLPGPLLEFMDSFYVTCGECLVSRGGRIVKYIGDGILALFPDHAAANAVAAGFCLREKYAALVLAQNTGVESEMEVGISFGEIEEGNVGHASLRQFDIFGESVNEAATLGHHRGVAVTEAVRILLSDAIAVRPLEPYRPKWRLDPLVVWEVVQT